MKRKHRITAFLFLVFLFSSACFLYHSIQEYQYQKQVEELERDVKSQADDGGGLAAEAREILPKFRTVYERNKEFAGWIKIEGTPIDYPVMKPVADNNYYLTHSPEGEKSKYGSIYLDAATDLKNNKTNYLMYGHFFKDGSMFGSLAAYKERSYYEKHPLIQFDTIYGEGTYEIISVFLSQVYRRDQDVFKYYQYSHISTKEEFDQYVEQVCKMSLYDTGNTAEYGDTLITLSTCDYWTENGRLAVVAKKISAKKDKTEKTGD